MEEAQRAEAAPAAARRGLAGRAARRRQERAPESRRAGPAGALPSPARSGSPRRELAVRKTRVISLAAKHLARQHGLRGLHTLHCCQKFCSMLNVSRVWPGAAPQAGSRVLSPVPSERSLPRLSAPSPHVLQCGSPSHGRFLQTTWCLRCAGAAPRNPRSLRSDWPWPNAASSSKPNAWLACLEWTPILAKGQHRCHRPTRSPIRDFSASRITSSCCF